MIRSIRLALYLWALSIASIAFADDKFLYRPGQSDGGSFEGLATEFLENNCFECHDDLIAEADLNLLDLGPVDETNAAVWKSVWAQVSLQEMPPKKKAQPEVVDRLRFVDWVVNELSVMMADKGGFRAHLDPSKGNFVDHELLFGALPHEVELEPSSSPARLWRVTPQEHITRLNELVNTEPAFNQKRPGLRTRGDSVPINHGGELKLYFGIDRITHVDGGTVAYATAVKSIPVVLASTRDHGFENYADFYSVNNAEVTRILAKGESVLRYMAYGPMSIVKFPEQITDDPQTYLDIKPKGDLRGLPSSIVYNKQVARPLTPVFDLFQPRGSPITETMVEATIAYIFEALTFRPPNEQELSAYKEIVNNSIANVGEKEGLFMGLSAIFLDRDALFRAELVEAGDADEHGRVILQDWELGLAVNHALSYLRPDAQLRKAIVDGRMRTRADVDREVARMLEGDHIRKPRVLRFFRDYFDYDIAGHICKDSDALAETGLNVRGNSHYRAMFAAAASTDRLVELILEEDKDVLKQLLTTDKIVAAPIDKVYLGARYSKEEEEAARARDSSANESFEKSYQAEHAVLRGQLSKIAEQLEQDGEIGSKSKGRLYKARTKLQGKLAKLNRNREKHISRKSKVVAAPLSGEKIFVKVSRPTFGRSSNKPNRVLATVPEGQRMGVLTHPSWLVSHSDAMDNHAILRGRWIRERLLGGGIPDIPITVDAMLPDEPGTPLRERMRVTKERYCWSCHEKMDPLGLPFEMYNHAGVYRNKEYGKQVDTSGEIVDSGDPALDGPVTDALDMIAKLAESERVEQVFVRHAFRFWMGRNETLNDAPVLQAAHKAYRDNGGSMKALIRALVTSDAFLFRQR